MAEHLLLTAGERAGELRRALLQARNHGVNLVNLAENLRLVIMGRRPHQQVFVHRQPCEYATTFRTQCDAESNQACDGRP